MKRRKFIQNASLASVSTALPFVPGVALTITDSEQKNTRIDKDNDRVIVIIRMGGANDGLNTFIPAEQHFEYRQLRPTLWQGENPNLLLGKDFDTRKQVYLHGSMAPLKEYFDEEKFKLIHAAGASKYNYSHFGSDQMLMKGADEKNYHTGMLGRYFAAQYEDNGEFDGIADKNGKTSPYAIHLGSRYKLTSFKYNVKSALEFNAYEFMKLKGEELRGNQGYLDLQRSFQIEPQFISSEKQQLIKYVSRIQSKASEYIDAVETAFYKGKNHHEHAGNYSHSSSLHNQLRLVARTLAGGISTKIFQCTIGGFDTHANQANTHAGILRDLSTGLDVFMKDIEALGLADRVVIVSYTEFGRTIRENGNRGTDHGNLAPMFLLGHGIEGGIKGYHPNLENIAADKYASNYSHSQTQFNYKSVYASLLKDWLGVDDDVLQKVGIEYHSDLADLVRHTAKIT